MEMPYREEFAGEIDLRGLLEVLLRGKWLIAAVTAVAVLAAVLVSMLLVTPKYAASSVLLVNLPQPALDTARGTPVEALLEVAGRYPQMTLETCRAQVTNPVVLRNVIRQLGLDKHGYTEQKLRKMIEAKAVKDSNLIEVEVTGPDRRLIEDIANATAKEFIAFMNLTVGQQISRVGEFIQQQINVEEEKLSEATREYMDFLSQPRSVSQLEKEVEAKLDLLASFRKRLAENQVQRESAARRLEAARKQLAATPPTITTKQSLLADPALLTLAREQNGASAFELGRLQVENEQLNPVYLQLSSEVASGELLQAQLAEEQGNLLRQIAALEKDLSGLQSELAVKQVEQEKLSQKVQLLRNNYESFLTKAEETRISGSMRLGETQIIHIGQAVASEGPVSPRTLLNAAVAGVLGLMVSVLLVFFLDYWRRSAKPALSDVA